MSIVSEIERLQNAKANIKTAIENKGVSVGDGLIDTYADKINQIQTGGGSQYPIIEGEGEHEVRFIDFDGTVLKIQYVNEGEDATPPELPEHELLSFIGWNNKTYLNVTRDEDVGASYTTTDGKTHIWHFVNEENGFSKTLNIQVSTTGSGTIDWGDGTSTKIASGTGRKYYTHLYTEGVYETTISHTGTYTLGYTSMIGTIFGNLSGFNYNLNEGITKIYFANNCIGVMSYGLKNVANLEVLSVGNANIFQANAITNATKLKCVVFNPLSGGSWGAPAFDTCDLTYFPLWEGMTIVTGFARYNNTEKFIYPKTSTVQSGYSYGLYYNTQAKIFSLPEGITEIGGYLCYYALNLKELIIPEGVTTIGTYLAYHCRSLKKIVLPSTLTSLGNYAFNNDIDLTDIYVYATTPPTLGGTSCFTSIPALCKIHVPADSLEFYETATNWSTVAGKMVGDL